MFFQKYSASHIILKYFIGLLLVSELKRASHKTSPRAPCSGKEPVVRVPHTWTGTAVLQVLAVWP